MRQWVLCFCLCCCSFGSGAQTLADSVRLDSVKVRLLRLVKTDSVYRSEVDVSAGNLPLGELLRTVAQVNAVNLCVKDGADRMISCNFKRVRITDLLFYLCREYGLELEVVGNIVSVGSPQGLPVVPADPRIAYDSVNRQVSYDLNEDRLVDVVKKITRFTGVNVVVPQALCQTRVSGFSTGLPVEEIIPVLAASNHLVALREKGGIWSFVLPESGSGGQGAVLRTRRSFGAGQVQIDSTGRFSVNVEGGNIYGILEEICELSGIGRIYLNPLDSPVSLYVKHVELTALLNILFAGTPYTFCVEEGIYLFGTAEQQKTLVSVAVIPMRYRTIENVVELIPEILREGMQIKVFKDRNSVIACGNQRQLVRLKEFLSFVDQNVPLITIEVIIVDTRKSSIREAGITAGLGEKPVSTGGTLSPGIGMSLSASSVNRLIQSFNGFGAINLGKVTPNFYMTLKALEEAGNIELRSTPKLSTLNGHEATLKSGETKYYKEVQNNIIGTQNPIQSESYSWKSVEANLSLKIMPLVSLDEKITLTIEIEQSEFTAREQKDAPPGTVTRSFKSQIRVSNEEMVLLGGIDRNSREKNTSGLPFIARIPVLKWLFGITKDNKVDEKLNVFIKPTVIY